MSRLTRDGIAEPVSRDQILRRERGPINIRLSFPYPLDYWYEVGMLRYIYIMPVVQLTTCRIGNLTRLILTLAICVTIHTAWLREQSHGLDSVL